MSLRSWPRAGAVLTIAMAAACSDPVDPATVVSTIEISPKSARLYAVGQQIPFSTSITTEAGTEGEGIGVTYSSSDESLMKVNSSGTATVQAKGGSVFIIASAGDKADSAEVEIPAETCGSTAVTSLTVGQVVTDIGAGGICVAGTGGDFTLIVHNNSLALTGSAALELTAVGVGTPPAGGASLSMAARGSLFGRPFGTWRRDVAAEMRHRRAEQEQAAPLIPAARTWYANRARRATTAVAPPAVGDFMPINVSLSTSCDSLLMINARVAAVSNAAIVLDDPRNPTGGYSDAEYANFAQNFETIINPMDVDAFGAPTDLDGNGRVLLVFTKAINERTPPKSDFYVGGLTHSRDLFPKTGTGTNGVDFCKASNVAEMFYLLVPDVSGQVNNNIFPKSFVDQVTDATIAHEYEHLISFARRKYINAATPQPFEEVWLNEGLAHLAEELLYYRETARTPRSNIGADEIFADDAAFDKFVNYMGGDFLNYDEYVLRSDEASPFEAGDELKTRGATWSFLRYAADQAFSSDGTFWYDLVNSGETGTTNLRNRLGLSEAGLKAMLRDFTITVYADDYVTTLPKYTHKSWNMRSIYPGLQDFDWPMPITGLEDVSPRTTSLQAGGFKVYRFEGIEGADSYLSVAGPLNTTLPASITMSLIRTR